MKALLRWLGLVLAAALALQLYFVGRIALMAVVEPHSTSFQRSEAWRIATERGGLSWRWRQHTVPYTSISDNLKRAVIAAEDDAFASHDGIDWEALEQAWQRNARAEEAAARRAQHNRRASAIPKIVGGSTITQQLAKNLFLSGERTLLRKGQEVVLTFALESLLSKQRILSLYLNNVEWGEGIFGAEPAARTYFKKAASQLSTQEAARLAVMLPRPKYFAKVPQSAYLANRAQTIAQRMGSAELP